MNRDTLKRAQEAHDDKHPTPDEAEELANLRCGIEAARACLGLAEEAIQDGNAHKAARMMREAACPLSLTSTEDTIAALRAILRDTKATLARAEQHLDRGDSDRACELMQDAGEDLMESWA